jgi:hypothetical protein
LSKQYRDAPVDPRHPLDTLLQAYAFLGQEPTSERPLDLADFWRWAIAEWNLDQVPAQTRIPVTPDAR